MYSIEGSFCVNILFGDNLVTIPNEDITELSITSDINKLVPSMKLSFADPKNVLGHLSVFDNNMNKVTLDLFRNIGDKDTVTYKFNVYRRFITHDSSYIIEGLLDINNLFVDLDPFCYDGKLIESLTEIANKYLGISTFNIGQSLDYTKKIINPGWSIVNFFNYLKTTILGKSNEAGYCCYIKNNSIGPTFVFTSMNELISNNIKKKYIANEKSFQDYNAAIEYNIFDNSSLLSKFNVYGKKNFYFDFMQGKLSDKTVDISNFPSLCQFNLTNNDNLITQTSYVNRGRSNDYESDFSARLYNSSYNNNVNLIKNWLTVNGDVSIQAGDTIDLLFGQSLESNELYKFQHQGFWLVERVVHIISRTFNTRLLLTRNGINTDSKNQLYKYDRYKMK